MNQAKSYRIPQEWIVEAHKRVRANRGAAGVDKESLKKYEERLEDNLYKLWNRMSSGSYFPSAVKLVEIPKRDGGKRPLGIPTVADRIAQTVVKMILEEEVEPHFHEDSYGYRRRKSALEAVGVARRRSWRYDWVIDLDIKGFFDNLDHDLLMKAVEHHIQEKWVLLYIRRWLEAPVEVREGMQEVRTKGTPQGGVISPVLANLYLHYAFDLWMSRTYPQERFERYADDIVVHCESEARAKDVLRAIEKRLKECKLDVNQAKTKIVYCRDDGRTGRYENESYEFLGYTFRARGAKNRWGVMFTSFQPAISTRAARDMRQTMRSWRLHAHTEATLKEIATYINPKVRGWINYYGRYYKSALKYNLYCLRRQLVKWAIRKYKRFKQHRWAQADKWLKAIARRNRTMFAHWQMGY